MDLDEARQYFTDRADEIRDQCNNGRASAFLDASAFIEYLAKTATDQLSQNGKTKSDAEIYHLTTSRNLPVSISIAHRRRRSEEER